MIFVDGRLPFDCFLFRLFRFGIVCTCLCLILILFFGGNIRREGGSHGRFRPLIIPFFQPAASFQDKIRNLELNYKHDETFQFFLLGTDQRFDQGGAGASSLDTAVSLLGFQRICMNLIQAAAAGQDQPPFEWFGFGRGNRLDDAQDPLLICTLGLIGAVVLRFFIGNCSQFASSCPVASRLFISAQRRLGSVAWLRTCRRPGQSWGKNSL